MSSQRPSSGARVVLELGKTLITLLEEASPTALDELERYCDLFADWEKSWKRSRDGAAALTSKDVDLGKRIVAQHATVIKLTEEMRAHVDRSLKSLRVRGKGLRAYTDHLPKRISTIRTRRG